jgi:glycosyltransferase involved in cell wall biosynthesis
MSPCLTIDARNQSGIGVYTLQLVRGLHDRHGWAVHGLVRAEKQALYSSYCRRTSIVDVPIYSPWEQFAVARAAGNDALLHVPQYNIPLLYRGTLLTTIHDLIHLEAKSLPGQIKRRIYASPMMAACVRRCAHIFTVSEYSRRKMMEMLKIEPDRITAIHNGVGDDFYPGNRADARASMARRFGIDAPFLLYVGNLRVHKNIETLLRAYAILRQTGYPDLAVVIVGRDTKREAELLQLAAELKIQPVWIRDAATPEVADLYRSAEILVQPSFEEGFGLPVVEAMACGTPVVSSTMGALPEIAGDAAAFFDPHQVEELIEVLRQVLASESMRSGLRAKGLERAKLFTWDRSVDRHVEIYSRFAAQLMRQIS